MQLPGWMEAYEGLFAALGVISLALFLISLLVFPLIIVLMPRDYFVRKEIGIRSLSPGRVLLRLLKNALGVFLFFAGILMLFLPGQGLLSIFLGLSLLHFPGKRRLELRLLRFRSVRGSLGWIRAKAGRSPLCLPNVE